MLINYLLIPTTLIALFYVIVELKRIKDYLKNDIVDEISSTMEVQKDDLHFLRKDVENFLDENIEGIIYKKN